MVQVWKIAPGGHADHWAMCHEKGCILIGWRYLKDFRKFKTELQVLRALTGGPGDGSGAAKSIWRFTHEIQSEDMVVANNGRSGVVGIGIVRSQYLPPSSSKNPSESILLPHARLIEWVIDQPVDLEQYFFNIPTVQLLGTEKIRRLQHAYVKKYPKLRKLLGHLFDGVLASDVDDPETKILLKSAEENLTKEGAFEPFRVEDGRERILASIVQRRGQPAFRKRLLAAYSGRCAVSGCDVEAVLEAAHIIPYKGAKTNHLGNGLLLRTDLHTLFDLWLVAIDPKTMRLLVSPKLDGTVYQKYRGRRIRVPREPGCRPSIEALEQHRQKSRLGS